jgi:hypothetical protein
VTGAWAPGQLQRISEARELEIASRQTDDGEWRWLLIWVVCVDDQVYVRTWYRRSSGWFGQVTNTGEGRIRVPGLELDVTVADLGDEDPDLRAAVDDVYRSKYGTPGDKTVAGMTTDASAATTLLLAPVGAGAES